MKRNLHRDSADSERAAAAATKLPNVRERHLKSAQVHDDIAEQEERTAASSKQRVEIKAASRLVAEA